MNDTTYSCRHVNQVSFKKLFLIMILFNLSFTMGAQFSDCSTGLLQAPSGEMQKDGTLMITNVWLNSNSLPEYPWGYGTFAYGFNLTFFSRLELAYVCTIIDGRRRQPEIPYWFNQDRHFAARFQLIKGGDWGLKWLPSIVFGISDPATGEGDGQYIGSDVSSGNGYFNRMYLAMSKVLTIGDERIGFHMGYQYNLRKDYHYNGVSCGVNLLHIFPERNNMIDKVNLIVEYDARTVNCGAVISILKSRFDIMLELQKFRWFNGGLRYKVCLN